MITRLRKYLPHLGFVGFYLFTFVIFCYLTFPYDILRSRIALWLSDMQKGNSAQKARIEIDKLSPSWFTGVRAKGVRYILPPSSKADAPAKPTVIEADEVRASISLLSRLIGRTKVGFYVRIFDGVVEGTFFDSSSERRLSLEMSDLQVGQMAPLVDLIGLPLNGSAKGNVELVFADKRASKANGIVKVTINDLSIGDGKAKIRNLMALPKITLGEVTLDAEAKDGSLRINKMEAASKDIEFTAEGKIALRDDPLESLSDVYLKFKINDAYRTRDDKTKAIFGEPGSKIPPLFEADPKIRESKRTDGFYGWHWIGALKTGRFDPYASSPPAGGPATPRTPVLRGINQ